MLVAEQKSLRLLSESVPPLISSISISVSSPAAHTTPLPYLRRKNQRAARLWRLNTFSQISKVGCYQRYCVYFLHSLDIIFEYFVYKYLLLRSFCEGRKGESWSISHDDNRTTAFLLQSCKKLREKTLQKNCLKNIDTGLFCKSVNWCLMTYRLIKKGQFHFGGIQPKN